MGKQRKKTLQELMQERATGTGNQSAYTSEPRRISTGNESVRSQVNRLFQRQEPQSFSDKVMNRYNEIKNSKLGYIGRSFVAGAKSGTVGIGQGFLTDFASQLQKGEDKKNIENVNELITSIGNPNVSKIKELYESAKESGEILKDKDKGFLEKIGGVVTNSVSDAQNLLLPRKTYNR